MKITLEELGWKLDESISDLTYLKYTRDDEVLYIDLEKRKIICNSDEDFINLTFATLEAIRNLVIEHAIL